VNTVSNQQLPGCPAYGEAYDGYDTGNKVSVLGSYDQQQLETELNGGSPTATGCPAFAGCTQKAI